MNNCPWKHISSLVLLTFLFTLSACTAPTVAPSPDPPQPSEPSQPAYYVQNEAQGLTEDDLSTAYTLCQDFLLEYHHGILGRRELEDNPYITNPNLWYYVRKHIDDLYYPIGTDVTCSQESIQLHEDEDYVYLSVDAQIVKPSSTNIRRHSFLVENQDGRLVIADWIEIDQASPSNARGTSLPLNNPDIWNDEAWVSEYFTQMDWDV